MDSKNISWSCADAVGYQSTPFSSCKNAKSVRLKSFEEKVGHKVHRTKKDNMESRSVLNIGGMIQNKNETNSSEFDYVEEILKMDGTKVVKIKRIYKAAKSTNPTGELNLDLAGKTVILEKKNGKVLVTEAQGAELKLDAVKLLQEDFKEVANVDKLLFPEQAVSPGDTWKIDLKKAIKVMSKEDNSEMLFDEKKCKATGKLIKLYREDEALFAEIEFDLLFSIAGLDAGNKHLKVSKDSFMRIKMVGRGCVDGSLDKGMYEAEMTGKISFSLPGNVGSADITMEGKMTGITTQK